MTEAETLKTPTAVGKVTAYTSLERGPGPKPGVAMPPFTWNNIEESPPPAKTLRGSGSYIVYEGLDVGPDLRLRFSTQIRYREVDDAPEFLVESQVGVQRRLALEWMDRERIHVTRATARWRAKFARNLAHQGRVTRRAQFKWARRLSIRLLRTEARVGYAAIRLVRRTTAAAVQVPDIVYARLLQVHGHLRNRLGRRSLWEGMRDPKSLSTEQKGVVMTLSIALIVAVVLLLSNVFSVVLPQHAPAYSAVLSTLMWGAATAVLLPFPPSELLVIPPYRAAGAFVALAAIVLSKLLGAWFVFFVGDALNDVIAKQTKGRPKMERLVAWMNRHASKMGGWILGAFMTIPFLPDTLALYVFAISGIKFRHYMVAVAVGSLIRYTGVIAALVLYGDAEIHSLFG